GDEIDGGEEADETVSGNYASLPGVGGSRARPLELGPEAEAEQPPFAPPPGRQDELRLDDAQAVPAAPKQEEALPRAKPAAGGSTLFERMTSLSRPKPSSREPLPEEDEGDASSISIPRFLGRQNNQ
ncbi:MAG: cell division protein FtsZ, partial [Novosphingobium sp.]